MEQPTRTEFEKMLDCYNWGEEPELDALVVGFIARLTEEGRHADAALVGTLARVLSRTREMVDVKGKWLTVYQDSQTEDRRKLRAKNAEIKALKAGKKGRNDERTETVETTTR